MSTTTIYLIRHGLVDNPQNLVYLRMDKEIPLSETGRHQISNIAKKIALQPIEFLYYSPLRRTAETAKILAKTFPNAEIHPDPRLLEVNNTFLQGIPLDIYISKWRRTLYDRELIEQGAESIDQIWDRMSHAFLYYAQQHTGKQVLAISHGDPIKIAWLGIAGLPFNSHHINTGDPQLPAEYPDRGSVTVIEVINGVLHLKDYWSPESLQ